MAFGSGDYTYEVQEDWWTLPNGWSFGWVPAVACDSRDRVFVYSRSEHPLVIFDRDGNFITEWGKDILTDAHGIYIDGEDNVYCTEREAHCVHKFNAQGELIMTIGTPGIAASRDGDPFNLPTDLAMDSHGDLYITDGYGNARVHKYKPDGTLVKSWGDWGNGPGQFELSHCVRVDRFDRIWVCDRTNNRIQLFDTDGNYLEERTGLAKPDTIFFDPDQDIVYVAELEQQVSIFTLDGELISQWGGRKPSERAGEFVACPHGIWMDAHGDLYVGEVQADARLQKFVRKS